MPTIGMCTKKYSITQFNKCPNFTDEDFHCKYMVKLLAITEDDAKKLDKIASKIYAENKKLKQNKVSKIFHKLQAKIKTR